MQCTISKNAVARQGVARAPMARRAARAPVKVFASVSRKDNDPSIEKTYQDQQEALKYRREHLDELTLASGKTEEGAEKRTGSQTPSTNKSEPDVVGPQAKNQGNEGQRGSDAKPY